MATKIHVGEPQHYIAALDIGTTTLRCLIYDKNAEILGSSVEQVKLLYPEPGYVEIDPDQLWEGVVKVMDSGIRDANLTPRQITCLGISAQRSSFTMWHSETGAPFFNIITWKDLRADNMVHDWNASLTMKAFRVLSRLIYYLTRNKRYLTGSALKLMNTQVTLRLLWMLENVPNLKEHVNNEKAMFGTLDTWLLYKLTGGKVHATDYSNAACTGFFDPFTLTWADWAKIIFKIPQSILPKVCDTCGDFGYTSEDIFGFPIPIRSIVADQSASLFGSCSFEPGDLKLTLGTGSFIALNTGIAPHASVAGIYPLIGWHIKDDLTYFAEGASNDTGSVIKWAQSVGLFDDPQYSSDMARSVEDTDGVYFIPFFNGIQAPVNDGTATAGLIGIKPTTSKNQMVRAILESLVFRLDHLYEVVKNETCMEFSKIRIDGGVSKNDFVVQLLADITQLQVERAESVEMSVLGAAFLAGLEAGVWKNKEEIKKLRKIGKVFHPKPNVRQQYEDKITAWRNAMSRFMYWYDK